MHVDVQMGYPFGYGKTRGLRDVSYWATFFDLMRPERWKIAERIIDNPENLDHVYRKVQLKQSVNSLAEHFAARNAKLRDPLQARQFEISQAYDAPVDERYQRIKTASQKLLSELLGLSLDENKAA